MASFHDIILGSFDFAKTRNRFMSQFLTDEIRSQLIELTKDTKERIVTSFGDFVKIYNEVIFRLQKDVKYKKQSDLLRENYDQILETVYNFCMEKLY